MANPSVYHLIPTLMSSVVNADAVELSLGGQTILQPLSFNIDAGEFVSIVGPSGCGKTSLLRLIADLHKATSGKLRIGGDKSPDSQELAYVFQDPNLLPWRTVTENVVLPLELAGQVKSEAVTAAKSAIELVGLDFEADGGKKPHELSGGMRMRVSLARAIVTKPKVMLFDEPFAALDDLTRQRLNEEILRVRQDQNWTGIFVTHNLAEAVFLSDRVMILGAQPATIKQIIEIDLPRPRSQGMRTTAEFNTFVRQVCEVLG